MDRFNTINPADTGSVASVATVEQPQAAFEQHLLNAPGGGPIYPHRELYGVTEEDDRLIQAASGAALERGPPPSSTTISIYDRRLRKLADALKQSGKSISGLDDDTLVSYARKLLPNDRVIAAALSMVTRYREPDANARPISSHYRASRDDERLIREAVAAGFGRRLRANTADSYASGLRKLAAALRPLSIAKLSDNTLLGYADRLFPDDKMVFAALNGLRDYRAIARQNNLGGGSSRQVIQPPAPSPMRSADEQPMGNVSDGRGSLPSGFNTPQVRHAIGFPAHPPIQNVAQKALFDAAAREGLLPATTFDAPVPWPTMSSTIHSPVQSVAQEAFFDAADREGFPSATTFDAPVRWATMTWTTHSPVQSVAQEALFDAADREGLLAAMTFDAPLPWPTMSLNIHSPVQSVAQEALFDAADREGLQPPTTFDTPVPWPTMSSIAHSPAQTFAQEALFDAATWQPSSRQPNSASEDHFGRMMKEGAAAQTTLEQTFSAASDIFDASLAIPEDFSHGTQAAPDMMRTKLGRWGLLPDAAQRVKTYDIRGERYTAVLGPGGPNDVQLIHLRSPAVGDTFDVSFAVPKDFSHRTQLAPDMMLSTLGEWDFLPVAEHPVMNYEIGGERYTAILGPEGPNDVQLIHHPRSTPGVLAPGFDSPAPFEWREHVPSALAQNFALPSAAPASSRQAPRKCLNWESCSPTTGRTAPKRLRLS
ncbi:hypothetical protein [Bradyrhizobium sp. WSM1743]|uniref:hypothetical protein n=1 Tax=Bradyrhizobium sp. WSM1743 TaxID=318996 RepID=UPI0003F501D7|nr:hypothetical protein [Bradyrhizobium sp. WSM1743]